METVGELDAEEVAWGQCVLPLFPARPSPQPLRWQLTCFVI